MIPADPTFARDAVLAGHAVFPLNHRGNPATEHGHLDARTGAEALEWIETGETLFTRFAVVLDAVTLLDLDNKHAGANGHDSVGRLEDELGNLPETPWETLTPNAGRHLYFACTPELTGRRLVGIEPGLDVLCAGWARLAGNTTPSGRYLLRGSIVPAGQLPALPQSWVDHFVAHIERLQPSPPRAASGAASGARDADAYFHVGFLNRVCDELARKVDGQGRRNFLAAKAYKAGLIAPRPFAVEEARRRLLDAALACGLKQPESTRTIDRQIDAGLAQAALERRSA